MIPSPPIDELTRRLAARNRPSGNDSGSGPYILLLGEGCALAAGAPSRSQVARTALALLAPSEHPLGTEPDEAIFALYSKHTASLSQAQLSRMLRMTYAKVAVPAFYQDLALLVRDQYFPLILTMNFDTLLEQALTRGGVRASEYRVTTFASEQKLGSTWSNDGPPLTHIVKLHGDLAQGAAHITPDQIDEALAGSRQWIKADLTGDLIMVSHVLSDDPIDRWLSHASQRELWWVSEFPPADPAKVQSWSHEPPQEIVGEVGRPQAFFTQLSLRLRMGVNTSESEDQAGALEAAPEPFVERPVAETLQNEILRSQSLLYSLEQEATVDARPPRVQVQIAYQKQRISKLEDRIWSLPEVRPRLVEYVKRIGDRIRSGQSLLPDRAEAEGILHFLDTQISTLSTELRKDVPNQFLVSASLGATLGMADRLLTAYGPELVDPNDVRTLAEMVPTAASKVVL